MMRRDWLSVALALVFLIVVAMIPVIEIMRALWLVFLVLGAAPIGAVLMLAIARLVGADWAVLGRFTRALWPLAALGVLAMLAGGGAAVPAHLDIWQNPIAVAVRAGLGVAALAFVAARLTNGAGETFAGVALALYAVVVTPVAADWLMAGNAGAGVSAIGMMLFVQQMGAACALLLVTPWGGVRLRRDMAKLLAACALGLGYLAFMDYLIVWYGNLPSRVSFYIVRGTPAMTALASAALLIGVAVPIGLLSLMEENRGQRLAGASALAGLFLFDLWWLGGGILTAVVALGLIALVGWLAFGVVRRREVARG